MEEGGACSKVVGVGGEVDTICIYNDQERS